MKKYFIFVASLALVLYWVSNHLSLDQWTGRSLEYFQKHPHPKASPAVAYYVGMYRFSRSRYPEAVEAFTQVLTQYPTGQYASVALFRLAQSYEEMRDFTHSTEAYKKFLEEYPDDSASPLVKRKLGMMGIQTAK
ncbi:MAG: tetratricopeptide repeat protein [Elusimicrobia bacterium]|nr:tetratricopeptide repeat protein [Elusimicrobiota bacterium]